ncbi:YkgJ family cysteine cluster protein [Pseudomaricurvus alcaniphilus]|uniref:YkgJ family cysteine cluster protein n=1 Tax=Pseudomaricurvus alcaniphilus TaxID=1166482 RepID=UPI00140C6A31|nr:YkgJ family cysteine cluster protein [Pseudomaricurvus alcaniphilus]NHN37645.1 YkgJ family cysteine cluster protein [Pseudomaricurvus alcaniphilus]
MECRKGCGMCCIEPSIVQPLPGMPAGKKAGEHCVNLDLSDYTCKIWGQPEYPDFCRIFKPEPEFCGSTRTEAEQILRFLESSTRPDGRSGRV